jgi:hypothetical protein
MRPWSPEGAQNVPRVPAIGIPAMQHGTMKLVEDEQSVSFNHAECRPEVFSGRRIFYGMTSVMQYTYLARLVVLAEARPCRAWSLSGKRSKVIETLEQRKGGAVPRVEARSREGATGQIGALLRIRDDGV